MTGKKAKTKRNASKIFKIKSQKGRSISISKKYRKQENNRNNNQDSIHNSKLNKYSNKSIDKISTNRNSSCKKSYKPYIPGEDYKRMKELKSN